LKTQSKRTQSRSKGRKETSAGAVVFTIQGRTIKILKLLGNKLHEYYVEIGPKGHIEKGESVIQAASREIKEEIGVTLHLDTNFREQEKYTFLKGDPESSRKKKIDKTAIFFIAFISNKDLRQVRLSEEHTKHFLVPIDQAIEEEKYPEQKKILEKAKIYIEAHYLT
jgi:8-oxo-dGTP pyrophosphatase MutT (NUDIX family)